MSKVYKNYKIIAAEKQLERQSKIPKEWLLRSEQYQGVSNLMQVPRTCGILSETEYHITSNFDATALLEKLKDGVWSAEQVTIAFCKRAAIAQQLVCRHPSPFLSHRRISLPLPTFNTTADQLFDRDILRRSHPASTSTRSRTARKSNKATSSAPRSSHLAQGQFPSCRLRHIHRIGMFRQRTSRRKQRPRTDAT